MTGLTWSNPIYIQEPPGLTKDLENTGSQSQIQFDGIEFVNTKIFGKIDCESDIVVNNASPSHALVKRTSSCGNRAKFKDRKGRSNCYVLSTRVLFLSLEDARNTKISNILT